MHWIDRGLEPQRLKAIRAQYTSRWIKYYRDGIGSQPGDAYWRAFHADLSRVFFGLCAYCEEFCRGEVEHFRPKSRFPDHVYTWSNWVFACHDCNHMKGDKWPVSGYIDPCARAQLARPERFFDFDTLTGEILVKEGLSQAQHSKAMQTITDLDLNAYHHLKKRLAWLTALAEVFATRAGKTLITRVFCGSSLRETPKYRVLHGLNSVKWVTP